jgi:hypothetical protein
MKFKHFETESGKTIKTAQFDGYSVGDRLLEGLMFQVDIQDDGTMKVYVKPEDEDWFDQFNTAKWLKEAQKFAEQNDIFEDVISGEDCWAVTDEVTTIPQKTGHAIKTSTIDEILNSKKNLENIDKVSKSLEKELGETDEENEVKEPVIGQYKPKRKFLNFVTGLKGRIRLLSNYAFIKGEQLSGMLEGVVFKITICDEGTINFEEVDTSQTTSDMIQRLVDEIDSRDVTGYTQKFVVASLNFYDDEDKICYLEVEHKKPIDMLFSLFDEKEKTNEITETGMSILDALFSSETDEELSRELEGESDEKDSEPEVVETESQKMMRESFEKMNAEKVQELKDRIEKTENDIIKLKVEVKQSESKIKSQSEDLKVLNTRLVSLTPKDSSIGYDFFVSSENKTGIEPDEKLVEVIAKIAPLLKLNTPVVIDMLTKGYYTIKVQKQGPEEDKNKLDKEIYQKIQKIDVMGKVTMVGTCEFEYRGDMTWHQLVDKMIRMGFEQNPDFDKECGSNSYESDTETDEKQTNDMKNDILKMAENIGIKDIAEKHLQDIENKTQFKELVTFSEPTDIVIFGHYEDVGTEFQITDDETCFELYADGVRKMTLTSGGFGSVVTLDEYKKFYSIRGKDISQWGGDGIIGGVVVTNFQGTIGIGAKLEDGTISTDFDYSDYIHHQLDCVDVIVNVPGNSTITKLNDDLSLPINVIRDIKIETIIK